MKITCNIIQDLLSLYVDQALSEDSCTLVEEHLTDCEQCRRVLAELKDEQDSLAVVKGETAKEQDTKEDPDAKAAFKKIRRSILRKRMISVCVAVACVLAAVRAGNYFYYERKEYIPWEDTGLVMKGDQLYATKTYYGRLWSMISPDQKVQFLIETETAEIRKRYPSEPCDLLVLDYGDQLEEPTGRIEDETKLCGIERVYYMPEEYINYSFDYDDPEKGAKQTKEIEEKAILLWAADSSSIETDSGEKADNSSIETDSGEKTEKITKTYDGHTSVRTPNGKWTPPAGSKRMSNGTIIGPDGTVIGNDGTFRYTGGGVG